MKILILNPETNKRTAMSIPAKIKNDVRVVLASLNEHCPQHAGLVGIFAAPINGMLRYEFLTSSQEKLEERLKLAQHIYYRAMLPVLSKEFEEHHAAKPAFMIEWIIFQDAWKLGTAALAEMITKHICDEAALHEQPPDDPLDVDVTTHLLGTPTRPRSSTTAESN